MYIALTVPPVPTGMKAGVRIAAARHGDLAAPRLAVGGDQGGISVVRASDLPSSDWRSDAAAHEFGQVDGSRLVFRQQAKSEPAGWPASADRK